MIDVPIILITMAAVPYLAAWLLLNKLGSVVQGGDTHNNTASPESRLSDGAIQENRE